MQVSGAGHGSCAAALNFPSAPARKGEHETAIPIYQLLQTYYHVTLGLLQQCAKLGNLSNVRLVTFDRRREAFALPCVRTQVSRPVLYHEDSRTTETVDCLEVIRIIMR